MNDNLPGSMVLTLALLSAILVLMIIHIWIIHLILQFLQGA